MIRLKRTLMLYWYLLELHFMFQSMLKGMLINAFIMIVFILFFLLSYDVTIDQLIDYQRIPIKNVEKMEIGNETFLFKSTSFDVLRIYYRIGEESGYFHSFKSSCFRFFNNLVITMKSVEEESGI